MKTIELPVTGDTPAKDILAQVLGAGGTQGLTTYQVYERLKLIDKVALADQSLTLEDADFTTLKRVYEDHRWPTVHPVIRVIGDAIEKAATAV